MFKKLLVSLLSLRGPAATAASTLFIGLFSFSVSAIIWFANTESDWPSLQKAHYIKVESSRFILTEEESQRRCTPSRNLSFSKELSLSNVDKVAMTLRFEDNQCASKYSVFLGVELMDSLQSVTCYTSGHPLGETADYLLPDEHNFFSNNRSMSFGGRGREVFVDLDKTSPFYPSCPILDFDRASRGLVGMVLRRNATPGRYSEIRFVFSQKATGVGTEFFRVVFDPEDAIANPVNPNRVFQVFSFEEPVLDFKEQVAKRNNLEISSTDLRAYQEGTYIFRFGPIHAPDLRVNSEARRNLYLGVAIAFAVEGTIALLLSFASALIIAFRRRHMQA